MADATHKSNAEVKTPAELLAANKRPRRDPLPKTVKTYMRKVTWRCRLRAVRQALRLSLKDVADAISLSVTALHQIEHGTDPQLTTAVRLAAFFGKTVEELWPERA